MALLTTGPLFSKQHYARYRLHRSVLCKLRQLVADASQLDRAVKWGCGLSSPIKMSPLSQIIAVYLLSGYNNRV
jgi:hypothetical protein